MLGCNVRMAGSCWGNRNWGLRLRLYSYTGLGLISTRIIAFAILLKAIILTMSDNVV